MTRFTFDEQDQQILKRREKQFLENKELKVGDFIRFGDGTLRRVAYVWSAEEVQTADPACALYLGEGGYQEFSGTLYHSTPKGTQFTRTDTSMQGSVWIFHHHQVEAHHGVYSQCYCPIWETDSPAPQF